MGPGGKALAKGSPCTLGRKPGTAPAISPATEMDGAASSGWRVGRWPPVDIATAAYSTTFCGTGMGAGVGSGASPTVTRMIAGALPRADSGPRDGDSTSSSTR